MRKNLCVGILQETKEGEKRTPLVPADVNWLVRRGIKVEIQASKDRIFKDREYKKAGAKVANVLKKSTLLLGIKEPDPTILLDKKIYMVFSHTIKAQPNNMPLLKECLKRDVTLVDYEKITDTHDKRLVYFGRFAGICGLIDSLHYLGKRLEWKGIKNPFTLINPAQKYKTLHKVRDAMYRLDGSIRRNGFNKRLSPFIIGITGHGNVSRGVQEILEPLNPTEIHPKDMKKFIRHQKPMRKKIYKIVFLREEKFRAKDNKGFYFENYLERPERFESNLGFYLPYINVLLHTSYWDKRYPRMIKRDMIDRLYRKKHLRLEFIGDISCDVSGSIELTYRTGTQENPTFTYDPERGAFVDGYRSKGITILARDNLPAELPLDSSREFSKLLREYVYQIAAHGALDLTRHVAIPNEIRKAVITEKGRLSRDYRYLAKWVK